ncbi:MAG TPA: TOMM precursor leader peptide-binding protein [Nocardioidaceae bacterium]|nr:TOMM precursor leader peptide-binding protein [Nocardioidaceae bacterium]
MRPILRPGVHVLRRSDRELQVGLGPHRAVVLADDDEARRCLDLLRRSAEIGEYDGSAALEVLTEGGLVVDGGTLMPLIPARRGAPAARADVAALAHSDGDDAPRLVAARSGIRLAVVGFGNAAGAGLAEELRTLSRDAGLRVTTATAPDVVAVVGVGEPTREIVDGWMRAGTPHLPVRLVEGSATVGPFVVPGSTACLRCLDAHHTDVDPSWPLLVMQYAAASARPRADGVPEPVDGLLATIALAWAARDLVSYVEGRRPSTWSATIRFDPHLSAVETRTWLRHPDCGCSWAETRPALAGSATMEA